MPGQYPHIEAVLANEVPDIIRAQWIFLAQPYSNTGEYIRGIQDATTEYPYGGSDLTISIANRVPYAAVLETGREGFHLPERIRNWPHHNKRGVGYMIIPFRHFTPGSKSSTGRALRGAMPKEIWEMAKHLTSPTRGEGPGQDIARWMYSGHQQRLRAGQLLPTGERIGDVYKQSKSYVYYRAIHPNFPQHLRNPGYTWRASKYEGLQRDEQATSRANQGVYSTFRVMTEDSQGWYIPPMPGRHLAAETARTVEPLITPLIARAAQLDAVSAIASVFSGAGFQVEVN